MKIQKKGRIDASDQQASLESINGMRGAMNEKDLEIKVIGKQTQATVEDMVALTMSRNIEEQVHASVNVKETFATNVNRIEVEL